MRMEKVSIEGKILENTTYSVLKSYIIKFPCKNRTNKNNGGSEYCINRV
jgi:hypothetical protein